VSNAVCHSSITRFVRAGDQLLCELKAPGTERENLEATTGSGERYGRVSYTHGGGIDRPLALHKEGWQSILPHESWRGQFASGTCVPDATVPCGTVQWPGWQTNAYHYGTVPPQNEAWHGGLVDDMRDATGQMYRRNRYYDPQTGQFTQPDPIGIAGGLNVYGFAAGDPVSYSDPYGLCAEGNQDSIPKIGFCRAPIPQGGVVDVSLDIGLVFAPLGAA
jgi:RHS repeat-associated protein